MFAMPKIKTCLLLWLMSTLLTPVLMAQDDADNDAESQNESASQMAESNDQSSDPAAAVQDSVTAANAQASPQNSDQSDAQTQVIDSAAADESTRLPALTLVAQPIYPQYLAQSVYAPLAEYLAEGLDRDIELITPKNFQAHWSTIKSSTQHDLAIEDAPLTDYRLRYQNFQLLVQAEATRSYSLAVLDPDYEERFDLVGQPVASLAAPSSAYLFLTRWYDNPLSQPQIISTANSFDDAVQQLWGGEVEGIVVPSELATDYPQFSFIANSESMPGLGIVAAPTLDPDSVASVTALLMELNDEQHIAILDELNVSALQPGNPERYNGYAEWIRDVSYTGFDK